MVDEQAVAMLIPQQQTGRMNQLSGTVVLPQQQDAETTPQENWCVLAMLGMGAVMTHKLRVESWMRYEG
jgi:hypothetical protein